MAKLFNHVTSFFFWKLPPSPARLNIPDILKEVIHTVEDLAARDNYLSQAV